MVNKKVLEFPKYQALLSIDLRCFDLRLPDYGVGKYFETLGFLPHILLYHETNLDQVHLHNGLIDETKLDYMWITQRGMPGGQVWTRRQLRELVDIIHQYGVKFYQGLEATWQAWPQYYSISKWPYEHEELFITLRDGSRTCDGERQVGSINPLVRMKDGSWYEDVLCRDLIQYLNDYDMDGYFSADGMAGLSVPLSQGDYSDNMIVQFEEFSQINVIGANTAEKANDIWENHRSAWIHFYTERWIVFYQKLSRALKNAGKGLATMDAWARSPADSVMDFGFDYRRLHEVGLDYYCMESREENWGRRGHAGIYAWEPGQVVAVSTIKAQAPDLTLLWALCTCNAPENWHALRDVPIVLERELMTLPLTSFIRPDGSYERAYNGYLAIFGIDLTREEWQWMSDRLDFSFLPEVKRMLGPAIVWSDAVYESHYQRGERWNLTAPITQLIMAGLPVRTAVNSKNLAAANAESYLVVNADSLPAEEVDALIEKRRQGADLIVIGDIENERLQQELGLVEKESEAAAEWKTTSDSAQIAGELSGVHRQELTLKYQAKNAQNLIVSKQETTIMSVKKYAAGGAAYYLASIRDWAPVVGNQSGFTETMRGIGEQNYMQIFVNEVFPDTLELLMANLLKASAKNSVAVDMGQYAAYETPSNDVVVHLENIGNFFYTRPKVDTKFQISGTMHFEIKTPSPAGYIIDRTTGEHGCSVNVIPDGVIPIELIRKK